jgi:hypothetical protein
LAHQYSFSYLSGPSHILSHIFSLAQSAVWPNRAFNVPGRRATFVVPSAFCTVELPCLHPIFLYENGCTQLPPLLHFHLP